MRKRKVCYTLYDRLQPPAGVAKIRNDIASRRPDSHSFGDEKTNANEFLDVM
ncbi:MAG TPA: hypothetical protein VI278_08390 [Nitrososphaeraceae archaeon]